MKCQWDAFLSLLPPSIQQQLTNLFIDEIQELRLRSGQAAQCVCSNSFISLKHIVSTTDLQYCINAATKYSPWTSATAQSGYITAAGGHRIGLCGEFTEGKAAIGNYTSLCIRIAKDYPGIARQAEDLSGSVLIIGKPGSGKTTLLRDLIRCRSERDCGCVAVVDERRELFPTYQNNFCFPTGPHTDVLSGIRKKDGIDIALRCLCPSTIALDEITAKEDCDALLSAAWCGVSLLATAHAGSMTELENRSIYRPIMDGEIFQYVLILQQDKSWRIERMRQCTLN